MRTLLAYSNPALPVARWPDVDDRASGQLLWCRCRSRVLVLVVFLVVVIVIPVRILTLAFFLDGRCFSEALTDGLS